MTNTKKKAHFRKRLFFFICMNGKKAFNKIFEIRKFCMFLFGVFSKKEHLWAALSVRQCSVPHSCSAQPLNRSEQKFFTPKCADSFLWCLHLSFIPHACSPQSLNQFEPNFSNSKISIHFQAIFS